MGYITRMRRRVLGGIAVFAFTASLSACGDDHSPMHTLPSPPPPPLNYMTFGAISPGDAHTCGITTDGASYCWGDNFDGQLGTETPSDRLTPTRVAGGLHFTMLDAG